MKIQLLIASMDSSYVEHISSVLAEKYADTFELSICSNENSMLEQVGRRSFEVALFDPAMVNGKELKSVRLPVLLWDGQTALDSGVAALKKIKKYQRISSIVSELLEEYAQIAKGNSGFDDSHGLITAVWSPSGGSGKTTVALAYAAQRVAEGAKTVYLDFQLFSCAAAYFPQSGKSISSVFEQLDSRVALLLQSIRQQDNESGIFYFKQVENYEDIQILEPNDVAELLRSCTHGVDEVVVDLSSVLDEKVRSILTLADKVFLVSDASKTGVAKWEQFCLQRSFYENVLTKAILVANRGGRMNWGQSENTIMLPCVKSNDPIVVYKTLSMNFAQLKNDRL